MCPSDLDRGAAVHDDRQSARARGLGGLPVHHADLQAQAPGPGGDGLVRMRDAQLGPSEDVHDIDRAGGGNGCTEVGYAVTSRTVFAVRVVGTQSKPWRSRERKTSWDGRFGAPDAPITAIRRDSRRSSRIPSSSRSGTRPPPSWSSSGQLFALVDWGSSHFPHWGPVVRLLPSATWPANRGESSTTLARWRTLRQRRSRIAIGARP